MAVKVWFKYGRTWTDDGRTQRARRIFNVKYDIDVYNPTFVANTDGVPRWGDPYCTFPVEGPQCEGGSYPEFTPSGMQCPAPQKWTPELFAKNISVNEQGDNHKIWEVVVDYETDFSLAGQFKRDISTRAINYEPAESYNNYFVPPRFLGPQASKYIIPDFGPTGAFPAELQVPILNTAGDVFDPSVQSKRYQTVITLVRTVDGLSEYGDPPVVTTEELMLYRGVTNNKKMTICGIEGESWEFLIEDIKLNRIPTGTGSIWTEIIFTVVHDPQSHAQVIINSGYNQLDSQGEQIPIFKKQGSKSPSLALLNGQGEAQPVGATGPPPYYMVFSPFAETDLTRLQFPEEWD